MSLGKWSGAGFVLLMVAALAAPSGGNAATIRHDVADPNYTALSAQPGFAGSGFISVSLGGGSFGLGSGTLVAPNWVLTAAHVVTNSSGVPRAPSQITFGHGATRPGTLVGTFNVDQVHVAPGWTGANLDDGVDIALIRLTSPSGMPPAPLYDTTTLGSELGQNATVVGYQGRTGTGLTGNTTSNLARRGLTNVVDAFGPGASGFTLGQNSAGNNVAYTWDGTSPNIILTDFDSPDNNADGTADGDPSDFYNLMGSGDPTSLEGASVPGDSGGGMFIDVGGIEFIAGVTSFVGAFSNTPFVHDPPGPSGPFNGFYGDFNGYTRVSQHREFITTLIPEPAGMTVALFAAIFLGRRRRV